MIKIECTLFKNKIIETKTFVVQTTVCLTTDATAKNDS